MTQNTGPNAGAPTQNFPPPPPPPNFIPPQPYQGNSPYISNYGTAKPPTNSLAIASMILGVIGIVSAAITSIPAIICGHVALKQIKQTHEDGAEMARAGLIMGYIVAGLAAVVILMVIILIFILGIPLAALFSGLGFLGTDTGTMALALAVI